MLKWSRKGINCIIELCQQTKKLQCMSVALKNVNIRSKVFKKIKRKYDDFFGSSNAIKEATIPS